MTVTESVYAWENRHSIPIFLQRLRQLAAPKPEWGRRRFSVRTKAVAKWGQDALATHCGWSPEFPPDSKASPPAAASPVHERQQSLGMGPDDVFIDDISSCLLYTSDAADES